MRVRQIALTIVMATMTWTTPLGLAHEGSGRSGHKEAPEQLDVDGEFYLGERGYLHGGLGAVMPITDNQKIGLVGHFVREESGEDFFPSLGAEWNCQCAEDVEVEAFSFGYIPVEGQYAWALGVRGMKSFELKSETTISPFFGPVFARVKAVKEANEDAVVVEHWMLFGGITIEHGPVEATVFGSHSFFGRDPRDLETHVDLEEMTHLAVYENNDGFPRNTVGTELAWSPADWLELNARYAAIIFPGLPVRNSIAAAPVVRLSENVRVTTGVQFLRGGAKDNTLWMNGVSFGF